MATSRSTFGGSTFIESLSCGTFTLPINTVADSNVVAGAQIDQTKLQHKYQHVYSQSGLVTSVADRQVRHVVRGAVGSVLSVRAGMTTANAGAATVTVDVWKNGTTILSAPIVLATGAAYALSVGTVSVSALAADNVLTVDVTVAAGGGTLGKGVFCLIELEEDSQ